MRNCCSTEVSHSVPTRRVVWVSLPSPTSYAHCASDNDEMHHHWRLLVRTAFKQGAFQCGKGKGNPKTSLFRHIGEAKVQFQPIRQPALEVDGWSKARSMGTPSYSRLDGLRDWSGRREISRPPPGLNPRNTHPISSRHTD